MCMACLIFVWRMRTDVCWRERKVFWQSRKINRNSYIFLIKAAGYWVTAALQTRYQLGTKGVCVSGYIFINVLIAKQAHRNSTGSVCASLAPLTGSGCKVLTSCQGIGAIDCDLSSCLYLNSGFNPHRSTHTSQSARCSALLCANGAKLLCNSICVCVIFCVWPKAWTVFLS